MREFLEQGTVLLGSATALLGVFFAYKDTASAPAYCRVSGRNKKAQQAHEDLKWKLYGIAPEVVISSNLFR